MHHITFENSFKETNGINGFSNEITNSNYSPYETIHIHIPECDEIPLIFDDEIDDPLVIPNEKEKIVVPPKKKVPSKKRVRKKFDFFRKKNLKD